MKQATVKVVRKFGPLQYVNYTQQTVVNIVIGANNFAFGLWRGMFVAAFNVNDSVWHVCSVPAGMRQNLLDKIARDAKA